MTKEKLVIAPLGEQNRLEAGFLRTRCGRYLDVEEYGICFANEETTPFMGFNAQDRLTDGYVRVRSRGNKEYIPVNNIGEVREVKRNGISEIFDLVDELICG
ncbi:MAG: hypothetical protein WCK90_01500 [archaeon]